MLKTLVALYLVCWSSLQAQQVIFNFDAGKSQILWTLKGNVHTTHGTFHFRDSQLTANNSAGTISGDVVVDATSGESGNATRDGRMQKEVLESERFPYFHFTPQKLDGTVKTSGESKVQISGTLQIHGATHMITIPVDVELVNGQLTAKGKFSIPYVDWGMKDPSNFLFKVDKSVDLEIVAVGKLRPK